MENDHGKMLLSLEALEETAKEQLLQLKGSMVSVFIREEKPLFCGQCANVTIYEQGGYKTFGLEVYANTYKLDMERHTRTFQSPSKTLQMKKILQLFWDAKSGNIKVLKARDRL